MTSDQLKYIQLRDCFYAGYSMPQYCIDNGIKNPMIASPDPEFLWELYVQFRYDKRITPKLCLAAGEPVNVSHSVSCILDGQLFSTINCDDIGRYDKIIVLTTDRFEELPEDRTIYLDDLLGQIIQYVYAERPLYCYLNEHRGVNIVLANFPLIENNEYTTEYEKIILQKTIFQLREELKDRGNRVIETPFDEFGYTNDDVFSILTLSDSKNNIDGTSSLNDNGHPLVMIKGGVRETANQEGEYQNTIWCMGTCLYYGIGSPYDKTIESYLQILFNENGHKYRVENVSQFYAGRYQDIFYNLNRLPVKNGDIVLMCLQELHARGIPFFDISHLFERPHDYGEVFADGCDHINERGNKIVAEKLYEYLKDNNYFKDHEYDIPSDFSAVHQYGIVKSKWCL